LASGAADDYPEGVYLVELAGLAQSDLLFQVIASAVGVAEQRRRTAVGSLVDIAR
jgi:predicted ATPase